MNKNILMSAIVCATVLSTTYSNDQYTQMFRSIKCNDAPKEFIARKDLPERLQGIVAAFDSEDGKDGEDSTLSLYVLEIGKESSHQENNSDKLAVKIDANCHINLDNKDASLPLGLTSDVSINVKPINIKLAGALLAEKSKQGLAFAIALQQASQFVKKGDKFFLLTSEESQFLQKYGAVKPGKLPDSLLYNAKLHCTVEIV